MLCLVDQLCQTFCDPMDSSLPGYSVHGDSPGKNTGVGCRALLQGIFPTQGSNPGLPQKHVDSLPSESPGKPKNTGVGGLSLLQGIFLTEESNGGLLHCRWILYHLSSQGSPKSRSVMYNSLWPHGLYSAWDSPSQNTGVGRHSLFQEIFPIQGSNPGLLHCRWILYQLSHQGTPRILEWVDYPFSSGYSQPRNQTGVSCTVGGFFPNWEGNGNPLQCSCLENLRDRGAIREAPKKAIAVEKRKEYEYKPCHSSSMRAN